MRYIKQEQNPYPVLLHKFFAQHIYILLINHKLPKTHFRIFPH